jgi:hypothetical protein
MGMKSKKKTQIRKMFAHIMRSNRIFKRLRGNGIKPRYSVGAFGKQDTKKNGKK